MRKLLLLWMLLLGAAWAQAPPSTVVFWEDGFPVVDTAAPDRASLAALPHARLTLAAELPARLAEAHLLVMPYGSAFPEACWPSILAFLQKGGNLLCVGGRPFSIPAWRDGSGWHLRAERKAWAKALLINDYTETPGSEGLTVAANPEFPEIALPAFPFRRAWSLTAKLSAAAVSPRIGAAGTLDVRLDPLEWGSLRGHMLSAPVVELDHLQRKFVGGRWVMVAADLAAPLPAPVLLQLATRALAGARDLAVEPTCALLLPGEAPRFVVRAPRPIRVDIADQTEHTTQSFAAAGTIQLTVPHQGGLHRITAHFYDGPRIVGLYRTGYWIRDTAALRSGPVVTLDENNFRIDGHPQPIVGSTYMSSDVQRQYLLHPNPVVWDRDFAQMHDAGITMIRTGLWSGWDHVMTKQGVFNETALRNLEALLLTARHYGIAVQFTFFAFIPDNFGGANAYLDPAALKLERRYVATIVSRFKDTPWLMWDLINEPSFDRPEHLWATRANGDAFEKQLWNEYLKRVHGSPAAVANAWNTTTLQAPLPVPTEQDFSAGSTESGGHPLMVHDFYRFAQEQFVAWARTLRDAIRSTGSHQLVTVGQDEGGGFDRLNPSYWADVTDFTTNHSWWQDDALLWDSLIAKQPGKPALIQETGLQNDFQIDESWRRTPEQRAALLEKKCGLALATTAGCIQWLWNVNADMIEDQEIPIGVIRADGTEKPEAAVMRALAAFAAAARDHVSDPEPPQVSIILDHDLLYSPFFGMATDAQRKAVRVLHNYLHVPANAIAENRLAQLGHPRLAILPSPGVLDEAAWQRLVAYMNDGGTLLVTGSVQRDAYWRFVDRLKPLGIDAPPMPLNFRQGSIEIDGRSIPVSFGNPAYLDALQLRGGWAEAAVGKGRLLLAAYPVELSEGNDATAAVYGAALQRAGITPPYEVRQLSPGVLVRPVAFADSVLYFFMSESDHDERVDIRDRLTGAELTLDVPSQRIRLLLLDRRTGRPLAAYQP